MPRLYPSPDDPRYTPAGGPGRLGPGSECATVVFKTARRVVIAVVGSTVVLVGVVGIVAPLIPAIVVIPAGLAILAIEFAWAGRLLKRMKQQAASMFPGKRTPGATQAPAPDRSG